MSQDLLPSVFTPFRVNYGVVQSQFANKLLRVERRAMECVSIDIECGCPLLSLINSHNKPKSFRVLVDIYFSEWHATRS